MSHKKFGTDRFSRFDVYWIQTNKQTNRQTDKPNLYIDIFVQNADDKYICQFFKHKTAYYAHMKRLQCLNSRILELNFNKMLKNITHHTLTSYAHAFNR